MKKNPPYLNQLLENARAEKVALTLNLLRCDRFWEVKSCSVCEYDGTAKVVLEGTYGAGEGATATFEFPATFNPEAELNL